MNTPSFTDFDDLESIDVDLDKVLWSDEPEQAYLEQIAGIQTTEDSGHLSREPSNSSFTAKYFPESPAEVASAAAAQPQKNLPPHEINSIGYDDDDVSTIANDTVNRFYPSASSLKQLGQSQSYYEDPEIAAWKESYKQQNKAAAATPLPPSPSRKRGEDDSNNTAGSGWSKKNYTCAILMALFLMCVIGGLGYTFHRLFMQDQDSGPSTVSNELGNAFDDWTFRPTTAAPQPPTPPSINDTLPPTAPPTKAPTTPSPTRSPSPPPTQNPTNTPSVSPTFSQKEALRDSIAQITDGRTLQAMGTPGSPQNRALEWLADDPNITSYLQRRVVQRFVMATLYYSVTTTSFSPQAFAASQTIEALQTWMDYDTNECAWFTSWFENKLACGSDDVFKNLALRNIALKGSIPTELALLTKLNALVLHNNELTGTIPREFGEWTSLGTSAISLVLLLLSTTILTHIFSLFAEILDVHSNLLIGRIPEWNNVPRLTQLILRDNQLTGPIPAKTANLGILNVLDLTENDVNGQVPDTFCNNGFSLLAADCDQVFCSCCTNCQSFGAVPTADPSPDPSPAPVFNPTPAPVFDGGVGCTNRIASQKSCYALGEAVRASFINCDALGNDWVGLFDHDDTDLAAPVLWDWTCGTQTCFGAVPQGALSLGGSSIGTRDWPLDEGTFRLHLFRRGSSGGPYPLLAQSEVFSISSNC